MPAASPLVADLREYGVALAAVAAAVGVCFALESVLPVASLALVFVCAVLGVGMATRTAVAAFAAVLASLAYNFFFTEPRYTLHIHSPADVAAVTTFLLAGLTVGHLAARQRAHLVELRGEVARREQLAARLEAARVESETEKLRTALLASVSHDLRTPLASILGSASTLKVYGAAMPETDRQGLVDAIREESERLDRYIQNLLDMTRLGSGPIQLRRDWVGVEELAAAARTRLARAHPEVAVDVEIEPGLPPLFVHGALIEQALYNVLDNAARFSPAGSPVRVRARRAGERLILEVIDRGPGIAERDREHVFDLFYTTGPGDGGPRRAGSAGGSGLGLTIVRGMLRAHGGDVVAAAGESGVGATIRMTLPLVEPPGAPPEEVE